MVVATDWIVWKIKNYFFMRRMKKISKGLRDGTLKTVDISHLTEEQLIDLLRGNAGMS